MTLSNWMTLIIIWTVNSGLALWSILRARGIAKMTGEYTYSMMMNLSYLLGCVVIATLGVFKVMPGYAYPVFAMVAGVLNIFAFKKYPNWCNKKLFGCKIEGFEQH